MPKSKYLIKGRLEDVITLITVLATHEHTNHLVDSLKKNEDTLKDNILREPISEVKDQSWFQIGMEHPEFFTRNGRKEDKCLALLVRFYQLVVKLPDYRERLSIDQTQNLIGKAYKLHEKAYNRSNNNTQRLFFFRNTNSYCFYYMGTSIF